MSRNWIAEAAHNKGMHPTRFSVAFKLDHPRGWVMPGVLG